MLATAGAGSVHSIRGFKFKTKAFWYVKFNSPLNSSWVTTLVVEEERKIISVPKDLLTEVEYIVEYIAVQVIRHWICQKDYTGEVRKNQILPKSA